MKMVTRGTCILIVNIVWALGTSLTLCFASPPEAITYGQTLQRTISPSTDLDIFTFAGAPDEVITIRVTRDSSLQPRVILKSPDDTALVDRWGTDWIEMEYTLTQAGTYSIEVSSHAYEGDYTLVVDRLSPPTGLETVIGFGDEVSPYIWPVGGRVHYVFYALGSDSITLTVSQGTNLDAEAELWSPAGVLIGLASCSWFGPSPLTTELGSAGWYHVIVHSATSVQRRSTGNNYLSLARNGKPLVETVLNGTSFHTGQEIIISLHMLNGPNPESVELRSWVQTPDGGNLLQVPHPPTYTLDPWADVTITLATYTFNGNEPTGTYIVGARLLQPITGYSWSNDESDTFGFSP